MAKHITSPRSRKSPSAGVKDTRPDKPYAGYPLFFHRSGRIARKVNGKLRYFGRWGRKSGHRIVPVNDVPAAAAAALEEFNRQWPYLRAGRPVPGAVSDVGALTVQELCNHFHNAKQQALQSGELSPVTFSGYYRACKIVVAAFGQKTPVASLTPDDFARLRAELAIGRDKDGREKPRGLVTLANYVRNIRILFQHAYDPDGQKLIDAPVSMGKAFREPKDDKLRAEKHERELIHGKRSFEAAELRMMLQALDGVPVEVEVDGDVQTVKLRRNPQLRAMVWLSVNAGYGQSDIANLHERHLDLANGWATYPRPKTAIDRRCALWPETILAVRDVLAARRSPKSEADAGLVFLSRYRRRIVNVSPTGGVTDTVGKSFGRLLKSLGLKRKGLNFYALRHTTETAGSNAKDQTALDMLMGHLDSSMAAKYREGIIDDRLIAVSNVIRAWLLDTDDAPRNKPAVDRRSLLRIVG